MSVGQPKTRQRQTTSESGTNGINLTLACLFGVCLLFDKLLFDKFNFVDRLNKFKWERNKRVPGLSKVGTGYRVQVVQYTTYTTLQQCLYLVLFHCRGEEIKPRQQTSNPTERQWNVMEFKFWCHSVMSWWPGVTMRSPRWYHPWQALSYLKGVDVYLFLPERGWCVSDRSERIEGWLPPKPFSFLFRYTSFPPTHLPILSILLAATH